MNAFGLYDSKTEIVLAQTFAEAGLAAELLHCASADAAQ